MASEAENEEATRVVVETVFVAQGLEPIQLLQLDPLSYLRGCSGRGWLEDGTGLRVCCATLSLIRLLSRCRSLLTDKRVLELGCGTGVVGLSLLRLAAPSVLVLTDGNPSAVDLTRANVERNASECSAVTCRRLLWSSRDDVELVREQYGAFDVIIGAELLYFNIVVSELVGVVLDLATPSGGVFLHSHLCRKEGQVAEIALLFRERGWITVQLNQGSLFESSELNEQPSWTAVRTLVSGPESAVKGFVRTSLAFDELTEAFLAAAEVEARDGDANPFRAMQL